MCLGIYNLITLSWNNFHHSTFVFGAIINIILSLFFFSQLLRSTYETAVKYHLRFWIAAGLILFNVGLVPLMIFSELFDAHDDVRVLILLILNFILYSCYSIGFLWSKREQN